MKRSVLIILCATVLGSFMVAASDETVRPAKISKPELGGKIFERPDVVEQTHADGHVTQTATSLVSSDRSFSSGMYKSGKTRIEITQPYGVDEFMYFLEGGVTLTSSDGTELVINAGEAVTVPKEWTGVFETDGYTKIWVIYSPRE
ncbi:MAG: cupin domain-containing protein [Acidobacteriota bacterium]|nr:cupin domain-containing protein [Acidobacteriota bacterium]